MKVLFWGHAPSMPVPYFRGGQFEPYWPEYEADVRYQLHNEVSLDKDLLSWPDVVVFRRWYVDDVTAAAWDILRKEGAALVYDTDDDDLGTRPDNPRYAVIEGQRPLITKMAREADYVTTATPRLATVYGQYSRRSPVVLRNAVDLSLYAPTIDRRDDRPRCVFYGTHARLRDLFGFADARGKWEGGYAYAAMKQVRYQLTWIGDERVGSIPREFDQIVWYTPDIYSFFRSLGNTHADVGLAPLSDDSFSAAKSELHWLEMTAAGIPVVAQRLMGDSPYSVIRHGEDGFLARGYGEWFETLNQLKNNSQMRTDIVAAARERMATEYDPRTRAGEWAEVFRAAVKG